MGKMGLSLLLLTLLMCSRSAGEGKADLPGTRDCSEAQAFCSDERAIGVPCVDLRGHRAERSTHGGCPQSSCTCNIVRMRGGMPTPHLK